MAKKKAAGASDQARAGSRKKTGSATSRVPAAKRTSPGAPVSAPKAAATDEKAGGKPAAGKSGAKKPATKKSIAGKSVTKRAVSPKTVTRKKTVTKKTVSKKTATKSTVSRKTVTAATKPEATAPPRPAAGKPAAAAETKPARRQKGHREIRCYLCGRAQEVSGKTMSTTCPGCHRAIKVEDVVVKSYLPVTDLQTCGRIRITKKGRVAAKRIQSGDGIVCEGIMEGIIETEGDVELGPKASWKGQTLQCGALRIADGARLEGRLIVPWVRPEGEAVPVRKTSSRRSPAVTR